MPPQEFKDVRLANRRNDFMTPTKDELTDFQKKVLGWASRGCGVSAAPGDMTAKERRECDALVIRGLLRKSKNFSGDKHGMYVEAK